MSGEGLSSDKKTLLELCIGIGILSLAVQLLFVWFIEDRLAFSLGLWAGSLLAVFMAVNMYYSLTSAYDMGEQGASGFLQKRMLLRYVVVVTVFVLICVTNIANPLAAFAGLMTLKFSAYLQPITHKIITR